MKAKTIVCVGLAVLAGSLWAQEKLNLQDKKQRISYSIGADIGNNFKRNDIEIDVKALAAGMADALAGKTALTDAEMRETINAFRTEMMEKFQKKQDEQAKKNLKEGEDFLATNAKKEGVKVTQSGLQYQVIKSGKGKTPKATDTVKTHYHGTLIDGTVFDSSVERNEPAVFPVSGVIPGWTEALQMMKEGDKWKLFIPAKLAYGERGAGQKIPPNSVLVFEIELLEVLPPEKQ
ncbi:MAG: FKBP-type peptidyl-prolyl cis-trans isomerase [Verrucomicrobiae bacterium]|nr:FKBP-type peptidyl-prolyl cis-trans isomerase [Verrucomicrobiae bacterium]